jgi:hypothetical protein
VFVKKVALADQVALKFAFSLREVSEVTGECRSNLYLAIQSGALKAKKRRGSTIVLADDLRAYLQALPDYKTAAKPKVGGAAPHEIARARAAAADPAASKRDAAAGRRAAVADRANQRASAAAE